MPPADYIVRKASASQLLQALSVASDKLTADFGTWRTPWGDINRFQRLTGDIVHPFSDAGPSIPVGFTASRWGSLASFAPRADRDTRKIFGTTGNSFVAESGDPASPHFIDQAVRYSTGDLREVYFYRSELDGHRERTYHPGE
jgi:acyl-homoserine-lactone acylase